MLPVVTPIVGEPDYVKTGYICLRQKDDSLLPICKLSKEVFWNEEFQFIFEPDYEVLDKLEYPFIPGIDLDLRKQRYYRVNIEPQFLVSRTPSETRVDLPKLLKERGLTYYDRMDFIDKTKEKFAVDNLTFRYNVDGK